MIQNEHLRTLARLCAVLLFIIIMLAIDVTPIVGAMMQTANLHPVLSAWPYILARTMLLLIVLLLARILAPRVLARAPTRRAAIRQPYRG